MIYKHFVLVLLINLSVAFLSVASETQRNINMDFDWKFLLADDSRAKHKSYDDSQWRVVNVPHDFSIEGEYSKDAPAGIRGAFLPTGVGWYRKSIKVSDSWHGKKVLLRFDGVYLNSDVWVNGRHMGHRPNGYLGFEYDISTALFNKGKPVANSIISVRVDHSLAPTGRWYTGSGIYRHVWLDVLSPTHIVNDGIFVRTAKVDFSTGQATLLIDTEINISNAVKNAQHQKYQAQQSYLQLHHQLLNSEGELVAKLTQSVAKTNSQIGLLKSKIKLSKVKLWSTESPYLYTLKSSVIRKGKVLDTKITRVGIRTIDYNAKQGFLLNKQPIELRGMSFHHDGGPVGSAVPDDLWRSRLQQLKDMGVNALRPAHTPFAPIFYDLADEMGFMIMNEAFDGWEREKADFDYGLYFESWWKTDLSAFVRRDRSHPSVIMWSVGNEVPEQTAKTQKSLVDWVKSLDNTRPVTQARGYMLKHDDIAGFNGHGEMKGVIEQYHEKNPLRTVIGTEITHTLQTRGIYRSKTSYRARDNPAAWEKPNNIAIWERIKDKVHLVPDFTEKEVFPGENSRYDSSYDNAIVRMNVRDEIKLANKHPYLLGTFRWTAFDYLGESFGWPARTANFGIIDLAGFEKDAYYLYQSQWSKTPMLHVLPHWTHPGKEGVEIPVVVYSNLPQAELFLNGRSLGKKHMTDEMQLVWLVPYQAGEITVIASDNKGSLSNQIRTADKPYTVALSADRREVKANQIDVIQVTVDVVDIKGVIVPRAANLINMKLSGPGKIIGVENGDILDMSHHVATSRKVFSGKLKVMIQTTEQSGDIRLEVLSEGLVKQSITIASRFE